MLMRLLRAEGMVGTFFPFFRRHNVSNSADRILHNTRPNKIDAPLYHALLTIASNVDSLPALASSANPFEDFRLWVLQTLGKDHPACKIVAKTVYSHETATRRGA
jgi:hypothetical protein